MVALTHQIIIQEVVKGKKLKGSKVGYIGLTAEGKSAIDLAQILRATLISNGVIKVRPGKEEYYIE